MSANIHRITTPADVQEAHDAISRTFELTPDGTRLRRLSSGRTVEPTKGARPSRYLMVDGVRYRTFDVGHILRHGPTAPPPPTAVLPRNGDWYDMSVENWRAALPRGMSGLYSLHRQTFAAAAAGLPPPCRSRVTLQDRVTDPRQWWTMLAGWAGEQAPELSAPWPSAHRDAPRWWALAHHLAEHCRWRIKTDPNCVHRETALAVEGKAEAKRVTNAAGEWETITRVMLSRLAQERQGATRAAPLADTMHEAHADAAEGLY